MRMMIEDADEFDEDEGDDEDDGTDASSDMRSWRLNFVIYVYI
jgi:hypothetical protein